MSRGRVFRLRRVRIWLAELVAGDILKAQRRHAQTEAFQRSMAGYQRGYDLGNNDGQHLGYGRGYLAGKRDASEGAQ